MSTSLGWIVGATIALPLTFVVGFTAGASHAPAAPVGVLDAPARTVTHTVTRTVDVPGPTRFITKIVDVPGPVRYVTKTVVDKVPGLDLPAGTTELIGTLNETSQELWANVWISVGPSGPYYEANAMADTGSTGSVLNAKFMATIPAAVPTGQTITVSGIGGSVQANEYGNLYIWAYPGGQGLLLKDVTIPDGLGRSAEGQGGVDILLGQNLLQYGYFSEASDGWDFASDMYNPNAGGNP